MTKTLSLVLALVGFILLTSCGAMPGEIDEAKEHSDNILKALPDENTLVELPISADDFQQLMYMLEVCGYEYGDAVYQDYLSEAVVGGKNNLTIIYEMQWECEQGKLEFIYQKGDDGMELVKLDIDVNPDASLVQSQLIQDMEEPVTLGNSEYCKTVSVLTTPYYFRVPCEWESKVVDDYGTVEMKPVCENPNKVCPGLAVMPISVPPGANFKDMVEENLYVNLLSDGSTVLEWGSMEINGLEAEMIIANPSASTRDITVLICYVNMDGTIAAVSAYSEPSQFDELRPIFEEILYTLNR